MSLHCQIDGPSDGQALLLINGLLADLNSWQDAMPFLKRFRVLRFDALGQGMSPKPSQECYDLDQQIDALIELLDQHNWPITHVLGLSHGGAMAMALALRAPQRLKSLVLAGCVDRMERLERLKIESWLHAHEAGGGCVRFDVASPWVWSRHFVEKRPEALDEFRKRAALAPAHAVAALIRSALAVDLDTTHLSTRTLILAADEDVLTPMAQMSAMAGRLSNSQLEIIAGAHAALLEQPELFASKLIPFWNEVDHVA